MEEILEILGTQMTPLIVNLLMGLVGILFTWLGIQANKLMKQVEANKHVQEIKQQLENNQEIVKASVEYVEKISQHLQIKGSEKFELAKQKALEFAAEKGANISEAELELLIEQATLSFDEGYKKGEVELILDNVDALTIKEEIDLDQ